MIFSGGGLQDADPELVDGFDVSECADESIFEFRKSNQRDFEFNFTIHPVPDPAASVPPNQTKQTEN